jgi:hypothetical protein
MATAKELKDDLQNVPDDQQVWAKVDGKLFEVDGLLPRGKAVLTEIPQEEEEDKNG